MALDTLYAEGQRRFVESFSPYARQFLERLPRPPMDSLDPVAAGVSVDRSAPIKGSRSTVATMADLEPYLAGLFAKESRPSCPEHGGLGVRTTTESAVNAILAKRLGQRVLVAFRLPISSKENYLEIRERLVRDGFSRLLLGTALSDFDSVRPTQAVKLGELWVVVDRLKVLEGDKSRLVEAFEAGFARAELVRVIAADDLGDFDSFRLGLGCPECLRELSPPRPGYFSYESPLGACANCRGFGRILGVDWNKVIVDPSLSLEQGVIRPWRGKAAEWEREQLREFARKEGIDLDLPWQELSEASRELILRGAPKTKARPRFYGVAEWFEWLEGKAYKMHVRVLLSRYRSYDECPVCRGSRLNEHARSFRLGGLDLSEWHRLEVGEVLGALESLELSSPHGALLRTELASRLRYLERVGLAYLSLDRQARTLSGGEAQRITLTAALGTSLHNALFVLDEPTVGLHPADTVELTKLIAELAARDNAVLLIEHEPALIEAADRVVELGPGAGELGGTIVFDGSVEQARRAGGATARSLSGIPLEGRAPRTPSGWLEVCGAREHNLREIDVDVPLGVVCGLSGPSGSGKSSLLVDILYRSVARALGDLEEEAPGLVDAVRGVELLSAVELVDQSPLGRTSRGNPATYTKAWDAVRRAFSLEPKAVASGFTASYFSFNVTGGRCEACKGEGHETVEMQFLADVSLVCPVCGGKRFSEPLLSVRHRGLNIAETLELTVQEAAEHFSDVSAVRRALSPLLVLGLGYLRLGQPLSTLSGGEAQRLKLARALAEPKPGKLYVLDEPSAGLHADEVRLVVSALDTLVRAGGSVIFVDHDLSLLAEADHLIELGPGGGRDGGVLIFSGTARELSKKETKTGRALGKYFEDGRGTTLRRSRTVKSSKVARLGGETRPARARSAEAISVRGAREHTLKNIDVVVPHGALTVVTGPSGSGKSTLAFDVIFAEGQRRFLETLSPYARRFLPTLPRPDVDAIDGVPPSIALEQRTTRIGPRSTVATVTEVAHYLRLAFAKLGVFRCPIHDTPLGRENEEGMLAQIRARRGQGQLLARVVRARKGSYAEVFSAAARSGIEWAVADGMRVRTERPPRLARTKEHSIDLVLGEDVRYSELSAELLRSALDWGKGVVGVGKVGGEVTLSLGGMCAHCGFSVGDVDPRYFSFNTVQGQCPTCEGTGVVDTGVCPECQGERLGAFSRATTLLGKTYADVSRLSVGEFDAELARFRFGGAEAQIAEPILAELVRRVRFLRDVGLDYLTLGRDARTLSGGEIQRLRLAAQLGAGLTGALYVLDEPTIGLHPRDTDRLIKNLRSLVATGSTVLMVEHDEDAIRAADYLIDLGPEGGRGGGNLLGAGPPKIVLGGASALGSETARVLTSPELERAKREIGETAVELSGATLHNLKGGDIRVPRGLFTVVAGVSGSGKSSLVRGVLLPAVQRTLGLAGPEPGSHVHLRVASSIRRALAVDQSPIGRTPRSVPATFLGIFDEIRGIFAQSPEAQVRGLNKARFSFNTAQGGRCTTCDGQGSLSHEMSFLPDVVTVCPACAGLRFDARTLEVRYLELNIGEVLALTAQEAVEVFASHPRIRRPLEVLVELGAGYIQLGQGSNTLSGGEAQRLKLAAELAAGARHEPTLYVLDEPTTGLHLTDVRKLITVLERLVERGDTLVVIEHHPDVIRNADWLIELGPEGGPAGGRVVYQGTLAGAARARTPTLDYLRAARAQV